MNDICGVSFDELKLKTGHYKRTCRYHRKPGQEFGSGQLYPKGCCPHLYIAVYPYALSLLYDAEYVQSDARVDRKITICCPSATNNVTVEVGIKWAFPYIVRWLKAAAIKTLQFLKIPAEYPDRDVLLRVIEVKGNCPLYIKKNDVFKFNLHNRQELCPASFYNLYPALLKCATGFESNKDITTPVHCPDPYGVFYYTTGGGITCEDFFSIMISVEHGEQGCIKDHPPPTFFNVEKIIPDGFCPLAFYSIYPYFLTLINGGAFEWVKKGEYVRVQCPKVDGVIMEAELKVNPRLADSTVEVRILNVPGACPNGLKEGDKFLLSSKNKSCFSLVARHIPFKVDNNKNRIYRLKDVFSGTMDLRVVKE